MAKININFDNTDYSIDESLLSDALTTLKSHLSTTMNGSGATISLDGVDYSVDSTKLTAAKGDFVEHLGAISGSGSKVVINGVEYGIDSAKVGDAIADLHTKFGDLEASGEEEDELAGTWVFNNTIENIEQGAEWVVKCDFISNGIAYTWFNNGVPTLFEYFDGVSTTRVYEYSFKTWTNEAYKTVKINTKYENLSEFYGVDAETFLAWLQANATKQGTSSTITFTIDRTPYQAEEGMTWEDFCGGQNVPTEEMPIYIIGSTVYYACDSEGNYTGSGFAIDWVTPSDLIVSGASYFTERPPESGGSGN